MSSWFIVGDIIAELTTLEKDGYKSMRKISISWGITMLIRATGICFFKKVYVVSGLSA